MSLQSWNSQANTVVVSKHPDSSAQVVVMSLAPEPNSWLIAPAPMPLLTHTSRFSLDMASRILGADSSESYWKPNADIGEYGLLEALEKRTTDNSTLLPVSTRPAEELSHNFALPNRLCINLASDYFTLSKGARVAKKIDSVIDDQERITGAELKAGVREQLSSITTNEYCLVSYRDYSQYALKKYPQERKKEASSAISRMMASSFVVKYFAVRIGHTPGCFVPLTEAQFLYGWERVVEANAESHIRPLKTSCDLARFALNQTQFDAMLGVRPSADFAGSREQSESSVFSLWNWTPQAVVRRFNGYVDTQYRSLGRFIFRTAIIAGTVVGVLYFAKKGIESQRRQDAADRPIEGQTRRRRRQSYATQGDRYEQRGGNMLSMTLKDVFDFFLSPS